ncbi:MAG: thiazole synthase, partial [Myxococcales bacterium]|nr:thiazole synthase [Myxococcales bacterium]
MSDEVLKIGEFEFRSRLFTGTGKYPDLETARKALQASGCEVVTVAVRRVDLRATGADSIMTVLREGHYTILPNTAGCYTAQDAVRTARLARELLDTPLIKLEVIGDEKTLFPDVPATLEAAKSLVNDGFTVLPYFNDDPVAARRLEDLGCAAV